MSYISLQSLRSKINELQIIILDTENEIASLQIRINEMTIKLNDHYNQIITLNQLLKDKNNLHQDCLNILYTRVELLKKDKKMKQKYEYMDLCSKYLLGHSSHSYNLDELTIDEIIEYSHKLHFITCFKTWLDYNHENLKIHRSKIYIPRDELDYSSFEMKNAKNEDYILFSDEVDCHYSIENENYEKCSCDIFHAYVMEISTWNNLIEFENSENFSIHSSFNILNDMIEYTHVINESEED
jgi:hypothetical protein